MCYGAVVFVEITISHKVFTLLLANPIFTFPFFCSFNFGVLFSIIHFLISAQNFSSFCWQIPTFPLLLFRFQFSSFCWQVPISRFSFSSVYCQIPTFRLLLAIPIFTLLPCKLLAETNAYFLIVFICVISAQLPHNGSRLARRCGEFNTNNSK